MIQLKFEGHDDWYPLDMGVYPNNEPYVKMADPADASTSAVLYVRPYIMQDFVTAMFLADSLVELSGGETQIDLLLPLVPGSRQDRLNIMDDGADRLFTLKFKQLRTICFLACVWAVVLFVGISASVR